MRKKVNHVWEECVSSHHRKNGRWREWNLAPWAPLICIWTKHRLHQWLTRVTKTVFWRVKHIKEKKQQQLHESPGNPVAQHFHCQGPGSIPGLGAKVPQVMQHCPKKKKKNPSQWISNRFAFATTLHMHAHNYTLEDAEATLMGL